MRSGDTLSAIALREMGNANRWQEIKKPGGGTFTEAEARNLQVGQSVYLPVSYQSGPGTPKGSSVSTTSPSPKPQPVSNSKKPLFKTQPPKTLPGVYFANSINSSGSSHASSSSSSSNSFSGNISSNSTSSSANASSASNISESTGNNNGYNSSSDVGHFILDGAGFIPGLGVFPDVINTGWYVIEGLSGKEGAWGNAALSGMAILPLIGDAAALVGKGVKYIKPIRKLLTNDEAFALAKKLGFTERIPPQKTGGLSHDKPMYKNKKGETISQDIGSNNGTGSHNGGVWKKRDKNKERLGTYNEDLSVRIGD